jgi:hypothetical protein
VVVGAQLNATLDGLNDGAAMTSKDGEQTE